MPTQPAIPETEQGQWEFLQDTYWYVPTPYLPAVILINGDEPDTLDVVDQTLWHIEGVFNGYVIGEVATTIGGGWTHSTLVGSITPTGVVSFSFTPLEGSADLTVGLGTLQRVDDQWVFEMQMTTGSGDASITHWAYMAEVTADDPAWTVLPGFPGTGVEAAFDDDPGNDAGAEEPLRLRYGTDGDDRLQGSGRSGVLLFAEGGNDSVTGGNQTDGLVGGAGDDDLFGRGGDDEVYGQSGADRLTGADGSDLLVGGAGNDRLFGGNGVDELSGGSGRDALSGGQGADRFVFAVVAQPGLLQSCRILDFSQRQGDVIDLSSLDARPATLSDDAFAFRSGAPFSGEPGQLRFERQSDTTTVSVDIDGDSVADLTLVLLGRHQLTEADFVL